MQSARFPVIIIDSDPDSARKIEKYIQNLGNHATVEGVAATFEEGFELLKRKKPKVVILEMARGDLVMAVSRIKAILDHYPQVSIFATSEDKSSDSILKVMKAGADEYILRPISETDLNSALQKHGRLWLVKPEAQRDEGRIISFFSPKGGVGTTTIAINLATEIYKVTNKPTIVVDLDLNAGDISTFLNMKPSYTISDVTVNLSRLDMNFLMGSITKHESGIYVLSEPSKVQEGVFITGGDIKKVVSLLRTAFSYIVIDTETTMDERTIAALEISDLVLIVFVMSLPSIKNIQKYMRYFKEVGFDVDKVHLVVNRYLSKGDIRIEDAERAINHKIYWTVPNDYESAMKCLNKGFPLDMCSPRSKVNSSIKDLAGMLINKLKEGVMV